MEKKAKWQKNLSKSFPTRFTVAAIAGLAAILLSRLEFGRNLEQVFYDVKVSWDAGARQPATNIVVLALDNESLDRMTPAVGRWPWPRAIFGGLVDYCGEARVITFDIIFPEPDQEAFRGDHIFAETVRSHGRVVSAVFANPRKELMEESAELKTFWEAGLRVPGVEIPEKAWLLRPYDGLLAASGALGHINAQPDNDGVIRSYALWLKRGEEKIPSVAMSSLLQYHGYKAALVQSENGRSINVRERSIHIPRSGLVLMKPFASLHKTISIGDLLDAMQAEKQGETPAIPRSYFKDKVVFIGSTATGVESDIKVSSVMSSIPGVYLNATALDNLMNHLFYRLAPWWISLAASLSIWLIFSLAFLSSPKKIFMLGFGTLTLYLLVDFGLCRFASLMLPMVPPLLTGLLVSVAMVLLYWHDDRVRRQFLEQLEKAKQRYTDMLVHDMKNKLTSVKLGHEVMAAKLDRSDESMQELLGKISGSSEQVISEMNTLLEIRRMEEGTLPVKLKRQTLRGIIQPLLDEMSIPAKVAGCPITLEGEDLLDREIDVDERLLGRLLENLAWNAVQHASSGTNIVLSLEKKTGHILVCLANRGSTIPQENLQDLFSPFWTGDLKKKKDMGGGSGLGLAFCKLAAEAHQGSIEAKSPWPGHEDGVKILTILPAPNL